MTNQANVKKVESRETKNEGFWRVLSATDSDGIYRVTRATDCARGVLVSMTSEWFSKTGERSVAESLAFISDARLVDRNNRPFIERT